MSYLDRVRAELAAVDAARRRRRVVPALPAGAVDFSSNDYLGLATEPRVVAAAGNAPRAGASGSRLLGGAHRAQYALEEELAAFVGRERVLLFSSGYLAALGGIATLARAVAFAYSDERIHASLIDGLRATKLARTILPHGTLPPAGRPAAALFVVESLYGMDGDAIDAPALMATLGPSDIAFVDEAHALGIAGARGAGFLQGLDDARLVVMGTLSKAFGSAGGFIAGPADVIELAVNTARPFIYDTAPALPVVEAARAALRAIAGPEGEARRTLLRRNVARMRAALGREGVPFEVPADVDPHAPFVPVLFGPEVAALAVAEALEARGFYAPAIRPPTVPPGSSRLRVSLRADHTPGEIDAFAAALLEVAIGLAARA